MKDTVEMNPNKLARIAGSLYLLLLPLGIVGLIYPTSLIVAGDTAETARNILANEGMFRLSIVSALLIQVVNILVVLSLYQLLKPVNRKMALMMVIFILVAAPMAMLDEVNRVAALLVLHTADFSPALLGLFLDLHEAGIQIAGIFWGLWLFPMGYLVYKSNYIPKIIGVLLIIGCFGYVIDSLVYFLLPELELTVSTYTFIGEIALPLWLVIKGVNVEQWIEKRRLQFA